MPHNTNVPYGQRPSHPSTLAVGTRCRLYGSSAEVEVVVDHVPRKPGYRAVQFVGIDEAEWPLLVHADLLAPVAPPLPPEPSVGGAVRDCDGDVWQLLDGDQQTPACWYIADGKVSRRSWAALNDNFGPLIVLVAEPTVEWLNATVDDWQAATAEYGHQPLGQWLLDAMRSRPEEPRLSGTPIHVARGGIARTTHATADRPSTANEPTNA